MSPNVSQYRSAQLLIQTNVSWERVQLGFIARERVYGLGQRDMNEFAWMASATGDRGAAREVIGRIRGAWDPLVWRDAFAYDALATPRKVAPMPSLFVPLLNVILRGRKS